MKDVFYRAQYENQYKKPMVPRFNEDSKVETESIRSSMAMRTANQKNRLLTTDNLNVYGIGSNQGAADGDRSMGCTEVSVYFKNSLRKNKSTYGYSKFSGSAASNGL